MKEAINITEASRFIVDRLRKSALAPAICQSLISQSLNAASILLRVGEEKDQKIVLAAMLFGSFKEGAIEGEEITKVFGGEVYSYLLLAKEPEKLKIPQLRRLQPKKEQQLQKGGRSVFLAAAAASIKEKQDYSPENSVLEEKDIHSILATFKGSLPNLEAYLEKLASE